MGWRRAPMTELPDDGKECCICSQSFTPNCDQQPVRAWGCDHILCLACVDKHHAKRMLEQCYELKHLDEFKIECPLCRNLGSIPLEAQLTMHYMTRTPVFPRGKLRETDLRMMKWLFSTTSPQEKKAAIRADLVSLREHLAAERVAAAADEAERRQRARREAQSAGNSGAHGQSASQPGNGVAGSSTGRQADRPGVYVVVGEGDRRENAIVVADDSEGGE